MKGEKIDMLERAQNLSRNLQVLNPASHGDPAIITAAATLSMAEDVRRMRELLEEQTGK